ncbi:MAG: formate dehydrogenase subunit gamma [Betaproteobacteria bacterium RIFCSPLOWO2_02_FULL_66_14]|nr:MAG: formate dehydrogenase subunit gamma [Betaproteobacteria bacterium RIFCSPLOWO2_02_FULL_66_14]
MHIRFRFAIRLATFAAALLPGLAAAQAQPASPATQADEQRQRGVDQPGNNAPVWRDVRSGSENYTSIHGRETGVLIQPQARFPGQANISTAGEAWRNFRNGPITFYGGWVLVLATLAIAAFYFAKGPLKLHEKPTGRLVERFSLLERWAHWTVAISFVVLALTGLSILFGKYVLLPILGYTLFAWLLTLCKYAHNFIAPLFIAGLLVMIVVYIRDNLPEKGDLAWFRGAFAMFWSGKHVPSGRFNAGEKAYFWIGVVALCITLSVTGVIMLFPNLDQVRTTMQQTNVIHSISAIVMTLFALGHIYVGTIGVEGAYQNMREGVTDETWAKEHHELWYNDVKSGKLAAKSGATPQVQH